MNRFPKTQDLLDHDRGIAMSDTAGHARADQQLHSALSLQLQFALRYKPLPRDSECSGPGAGESIVENFKSARHGPAWHDLAAVELIVQRYEHWMKTQPCISPDLYDQTDKVRREATARAVELRYGITVSRPTHSHATAAHSLGRQRGDALATARARQRGSITPYTPEGRF